MGTIETLKEIIIKIQKLQELILRAKTYCDATRNPIKIATSSKDQRGFDERYYDPSLEISGKVVILIKQETLKEIDVWEKELKELTDPLNVAMFIQNNK